MTMKAFIACLLLCTLIILFGYTKAEDYSKIPAVAEVRKAGLDIKDSVMDQISADFEVDISELSANDLLLVAGIGDLSKGFEHWSPRTDQVYAFDAEVFDIERMYTLFLQGVQAIVPEIEITDIHEDLSKITDEMKPSPTYPWMETDGLRSVSFLCNGHPYSIELESNGDWFNTKFFDFMDQVLSKEKCTKQLYEFQSMIQYVIVVYTDRTTAEKIDKLIRPY